MEPREDPSRHAQPHRFGDTYAYMGAAALQLLAARLAGAQAWRTELAARVTPSWGWSAVVIVLGVAALVWGARRGGRS